MAGSEPGRGHTDRMDEDEIEYTILEPQQADALPRRLALEWRNLFATAFFVGMRKGKLLGMLKEDVNLVEQTLTIRRSHGGQRIVQLLINRARISVRGRRARPCYSRQELAP